jgi:glycosyltransferase involved in cell wall biosynthesis
VANDGPVRRRIAVITADVLGRRMAGPAIRAFHVAEALATDHDVTLVSTAQCTVSHESFLCRYVPWAGLRDAVGDADVVVFQGFVSYHAPWLIRGDQILVVDLYDPIHLEQLEQLVGRSAMERHATLDLTVRVLNEQLVRGDFFVCASEEQRHLWLGQLSAFGRINPENYDRDPTLRQLIAVCPFGLPSTPPVSDRPAIKGVVDGIGPADKVVLWAGGVYNWFDPITAILAVDRLRHTHDDVRLYFLGMAHPNPDVPTMRMAVRAREVARELGLTDRYVFFNEGWVEYDDRQRYLLDADVGISTHLQHVETTFSFRTRILDYLWAGLPIVATGGDSFGELVYTEGLGVRVDERDVAGVTEALRRTLYDEQFAADAVANVAKIRSRFTWEQALAPLVAFCAAAERAADGSADVRRLARRPVLPPSRLGRDATRAWTLWREGGPALLTSRVSARLGRLRRERDAVRREDSSAGLGTEPPPGEVRG